MKKIARAQVNPGEAETKVKRTNENLPCVIRSGRGGKVENGTRRREENTHNRGNAAVGDVRPAAGHHGDAVNDGADGDAEGAARAVVGDAWQMGDGVEVDLQCRTSTKG